MPKSTSVTLAVDEKTLPMATITGRTDRQTDRVRRNMRPPPREEGRIKKNPAEDNATNAGARFLHAGCSYPAASSVIALKVKDN